MGQLFSCINHYDYIDRIKIFVYNSYKFNI